MIQLHREHTKTHIPFTSMVFINRMDADIIDPREFVEEVVTQPSLHMFADLPSHVGTNILNILEYYGLLIPHAKILIPLNQDGKDENILQGKKINSYPVWAIWQQNGQRWMFRVFVKKIRGISHYLEHISGTILLPLNVGFWEATRGLSPSLLKRYAQDYPKEYKRYEENPFDIHSPLIWNGNTFYDGQMVIPVFRKEDVTWCIQLISFLNRKLPIELAILAWFENYKRTRKGNPKFPKPDKLIGDIWKVLFKKFNKDSILEPDRLNNVPFNKNFYRNHYITAFVYSHVQRGLKITQACIKAAEKLLKANQQGEEPLDPEYIRSRIYYPTLRKLKKYNELYL